MSKKTYLTPAARPLGWAPASVLCTSDNGVVVEGEDMDPWEDNDDNS